VAEPSSATTTSCPNRWVAKTGRGLHLWYSSIEPSGSMKLGTLLDLKGQGGYVAAPPSLHPDGHRYTWLLEPDDEPPMEAPDALLDASTGTTSTARAIDPQARPPPRPPSAVRGR
jgi:hypothetical protein